MAASACALLLCAAPQAQKGPGFTPSIDAFLQDVPFPVGPPTDLMGTTVNGMLIRQRTIVSKASLPVLHDYFVNVFRRAGLWFAPEASQLGTKGGTQVTGLDRENLKSYSAILQSNAHGTTIVMASADLAHLATPKATDVANAPGPVYPGGHQLTTYSLEGLHVMNYAVQATPAELKTFYRETYKKAGYVEESELRFVKGTESATVIVSPGVSERTVMVQTGTFKQEKNPIPQLQKVSE